MATSFFPCSRCGHQTTAETRFCPSCGTAMARATPPPEATGSYTTARGGAVPPPPSFNATQLCAQCGTEFGVSARFCPNCGAVAGASASRPAPAPTPRANEYAVPPHAPQPAAQPPSGAPFLCARCGSQISPGTNFCPRCGNSAVAVSAVANRTAYAGFWVRFVADMIDSAIAAGIFLLFLWVPIANIFISFAVICLYGALSESSAHQATLGKRAMGLKVTDLEGRRITFGKGLGRWLLKEVFSLTVLLWLTFLAIVFSEKRQGVHDMIAGTLVWKTR